MNCLPVNTRLCVLLNRSSFWNRNHRKYRETHVQYFIAYSPRVIKNHDACIITSIFGLLSALLLVKFGMKVWKILDKRNLHIPLSLFLWSEIKFVEVGSLSKRALLYQFLISLGALLWFDIRVTARIIALCCVANTCTTNKLKAKYTLLGIA